MKRLLDADKKSGVLYKIWIGYGKHKWFGKWGNGKDWRWYLYRAWMWVGNKNGYVRKYNTERDIALENARIALEEAFTPQLQAMLGDKYNEK